MTHQAWRQPKYPQETLSTRNEDRMQLGMIGLGRMGGNMASRIREAGHTIVGYDRAPDSGRDVTSLEELVRTLQTPRVIWVMLPAGAPTDSTIAALSTLLAEGDLVIDGGNTKYTDDAPHEAILAEHSVHFLEAGVSGGVWGPKNGYALMVGGKQEDFDSALPIFNALKPEGEAGLVLAGPVGAGHFAKMVHNGIEYGMMQALGEGYATMTHSDLITNPTQVVDSWTSGTVIKSWLLDLLALALKKDPNLASMPPVANESGEARWMVDAALELGVPVPATAAALFARQSSRGGSDDALRVVSALRGQFGGHITEK
jgi:6-phosphogluconate dehydrogenase